MKRIFCRLFFFLSVLLPLTASAADLLVLVTDQNGKPAENAVIVASPPGAPPAPVLSEAAIIEQKGKEFLPPVTVITAGSLVRFPNRDTVQHHVYSFSQTKKFDIPLYQDQESAGLVFDRPGVVVLGCNIHDWMKVHIFVTDKPFFAVTGADGTARLIGLPEGPCQVEVWHPGLRKIDKNPFAQSIILSGKKKPPYEVTLVLK